MVEIITFNRSVAAVNKERAAATGLRVYWFVGEAFDSQILRLRVTYFHEDIKSLYSLLHIRSYLYRLKIRLVIKYYFLVFDAPLWIYIVYMYYD